MDWEQEFKGYETELEPEKRERAYSWLTAIGLQDVDGLKTSDFLRQTARRNIDGEITQNEAVRLVEEYYATKEGMSLPADVHEADVVAARLGVLISEPTFSLAPEFLHVIHRRLFAGLFPHAGIARILNIAKREWVLNGDTVYYADAEAIPALLKLKFEAEAAFNYVGLGEDAFLRHLSEFVAGLWQIHPFMEGNTRTVAVFTIKYLRSKRYDVTNDLFARHAWYFRNALVRANYENPQQRIAADTQYLEDFFKSLVFGEVTELKNRYLRIGFEYGSEAAKRLDDAERKVKTRDRVMVLIKGNPTISISAIAKCLNISRSAIAKHVDVLKRTSGLSHQGSRKGGRWTWT